MQSLLGVWRLVEARAVDPSGNQLPSPLGSEPMGIVEFGPDRMVVAVVSLPPDAKHRILSGYSGAYSCDGKELITRVDAAANPAMIGTEQVRRIEFDGARLVASPKNEVLGHAPESLALVWERA